MTVSIGSPAPNFALPNQDGEVISLNDLAGRWVLLYWYPKAGTPGCATQAVGLRDQTRAFAELGAVVLGASFDAVEELRSFHRSLHLTFDLLSDGSHTAGTEYGVAGDGGTAVSPSRMSFLIDPTGKVVQIYEVGDPASHADHVLDDLEALQDAG